MAWKGCTTHCGPPARAATTTNGWPRSSIRPCNRHRPTGRTGRCAPCPRAPASQKAPCSAGSPCSGCSPSDKRTFKLSTDPFFIEKVRDIVGLYLNPPDHHLVCRVGRGHRQRAQPVSTASPASGISGLSPAH